MKMKFQWVMALLLITGWATSAQGQGQVDYEQKHEIGITLGGATNSSIIDDFEEATVIELTGGAAKYTHSKHFGGVSLEYFYRVRPMIAIGAIAAYSHQKKDVELNSEKVGKCNMNYFTLMPALKFDWLRRSHWGMYSKVAAGLTVRHEKMDLDNQKDDSFTDTFFDWQVSLIGIEGGSQRVRAFAELGMGEQGIGLIGLRYRF